MIIIGISIDQTCAALMRRSADAGWRRTPRGARVIIVIDARAVPGISLRVVIGSAAREDESGCRRRRRRRNGRAVATHP